MTVTELRAMTKGRFEVYLNDEFAFVLYKAELKKYNIEVGRELSEDILLEIHDEVLSKRAKKRAMNLLLKSDMTEMKLRQKLVDGKYPMDIVDEAIEYVKSYKYIDDRRYAKSFIAFQSQTNSRNVVMRKLIEKGIDKSIVIEELEEFYDNDELNAGLEDELIERLIRKKCKDLDSLDYESKQKLMASIMRKGFSFGSVEKVLNRLT